jgi:hypothetical protein
LATSAPITSASSSAPLPSTGAAASSSMPAISAPPPPRLGHPDGRHRRPGARHLQPAAAYASHLRLHPRLWRTGHRLRAATAARAPTAGTAATANSQEPARHNHNPSTACQAMACHTRFRRRQRSWSTQRPHLSRCPLRRSNSSPRRRRSRDSPGRRRSTTGTSPSSRPRSCQMTQPTARPSPATTSCRPHL